MYNAFFKKQIIYFSYFNDLFFFSGHQSEDLYDFNTHLFSVAHR